MAGSVPATWVTWINEGYLYLKDRKQDMIVTGGENVYSSEVEAVLNLHPGCIWKLPSSVFPMKSTVKR